MGLAEVCEMCGKKMSLFTVVKWMVPDINGKKHTVCADCMNKVKAAGKHFKFDEESQKLIMVDQADREVRKKCDACGFVFCYDPSDVAKNKANSRNSALSALAGLSAAVDGMYTTSAVHTANSDRANANIVDFNKCPKCGSRVLRVLSKEEFQEETQKNQSSVPATSAADELKKFKDLLDSGVITQAEFDAKKKQLLGL